VSWKHAHVSSLHLDWYDSTGNPAGIGDGQPNGSKFSTLTPPGVDAGGSVQVDVTFNDGTGAKLQPASCT
jgi:hypothetical protein